MKEYRVSKNREEIIKVVQNKIKSENLMTIWQKDPKTGSRSFKCDVKFSSLNPHEGHFSVNITDDDKKLFKPELETYFLLQIQDFVFKTKTSINYDHKKSDALIFQIPQDVRLKEKRISPRVYIRDEEKKYVSVKFNCKRSGCVDVSCPIYNISDTGICIIVSKETLSTIKLDEEIALEGLKFFESLPNQMKANVRNARVYSKLDFGSDELYALGFEFKTS